MAEKLVFTDKRVEHLECPRGKAGVYVYDDKQPGLCVWVSASGVKTFYVYKKIDGRPERVKLERFPAIDVDTARDLAAVKIGEIAGGSNPAAKRRTARGEQTLGEVFKRFIDEWGKVRKRTWQDDQEQFDRHCTSLSDRRLSAIHLRDIQKLHNDIGGGDEGAPYAANRVLAMLSSVFNFARTVGFEGGNPCKGVKRFKESSRRRFLRPDEMPKFLAAMDEHDDQAVADFFRLALFTGARRSNLQSAAWGNVNFARKVWTIPADQSKSGEAINVHLTPAAMDVLRRRWEQRIDGKPWVFPSYGKTGHFTEPKAAWKEILKRADITDLRLHDLRRTYGSWLTAAGAPAAVVAEALGQTTQHVTHVYTRVDLGSVASAVDVATAAMMKTAEPASKPAKGKTTTKRKAG